MALQAAVCHNRLLTELLSTLFCCTAGCMDPTEGGQCSCHHQPRRRLLPDHPERSGRHWCWDHMPHSSIFWSNCVHHLPPTHGQKGQGHPSVMAGTSPHLQQTVAVDSCSGQLQETVAVDSCSRLLQWTVAVDSCSGLLQWTVAVRQLQWAV